MSTPVHDARASAFYRPTRVRGFSLRLAVLRAGRVTATIVAIFSAFVLLGLGVGPRTGTYRTMTVLTNSMAPGMPAGSIAVVRPVPVRSLKVGDVISYPSPLPGHPIVTHRISAIRAGGAHPVVQTQGDASTAPDPWQVQLGGDRAWRRVFVVPFAGWAVHDLRVAESRLPLLTVVPFLLYGVFLIRLWRPGRPARPRVAT